MLEQQCGDSQMTSRVRFRHTLQLRPVDRRPVWLMRQAGRYLPEYRALRQDHGFLEMVKTPVLATEITLQPLRRFPLLDAAILFSDILVVPEALGLSYNFRETGGIVMSGVIRDRAGLAALRPSEALENLEYVASALRLTRRELGPDKALLGFSGTPWTLACYMIQGCSADGFPAAVALLEENATLLQELLEVLAATVADYLHMQIAAGVDAVQLFDSWAACCPSERYAEISLRWVAEIIRTLPAGFPVILFARGRDDRIAEMADCGARALSLGPEQSLRATARRLPRTLALQGNLPPEILCASPAETSTATLTLLQEMADYPGHMVNLGHGVRPDARLECVSALLETVADFRIQ